MFFISLTQSLSTIRFSAVDEIFSAAVITSELEMTCLATQLQLGLIIVDFGRLER